MRAVSLFALLLLVSCGPGPAPGPIGEGEGEGEIALIDPDGDVPFGFIDIVRAGCTPSEASVDLWMEMLTLPDLPFQRSDVAVNTLEYAWNIRLDANADGEDELLASATSYNFGGFPVTGPMHENVDSALYAVAGAGLTTIDRVDIASADNRITFTVPREMHPALADIGTRVPLLVTTSYNDATGLHGDEAERE